MGKNGTETVSTGRRVGRIFRNIGLGILGALLLLLLAITVIPLTEHSRAGAEYGVDTSESADWMGLVDGTLLLSELNLPGSHDAATEHVELAFFSRCQDSGIAEQLEEGYRYLDIRLAVDYTDGEESLKLMHGFCTCRTGNWPWSGVLYLENVLEDCYSFLEEHPTETIVFCIKHEYGDESLEDFQRILNNYVQANADAWYLENRIPTLEEARGKLVLVRRYADALELGDEGGLAIRWVDQNETEPVEIPYTIKESENITIAVQDRYCYGTEDKWDAFCLTAEEAYEAIDGDGVVLNFLSTKGTFSYGHAYWKASKLNPRIFETGYRDGDHMGWVIMDFTNAPMAKMIYSTNY